MDTITTHQAYLAMFTFLEERWKVTGEEDLAALLGDLSLLPDGGPADPAVASAWEEAVARARDGGVDATLVLGRP